MVSNLLLLWLLGDVQQLHGFLTITVPSHVMQGHSSTILAPLFSLASLALEILHHVRMGQIDYHGSSCLGQIDLSVTGFKARTRLPVSWVNYLNIS